MSRPQAVPESVICSECGLDWDDHPDNPRRRDCIKLLVAALHARSMWSFTNTPDTDTSHFIGSDITGSTMGQIVTGMFPENDDPDMGVPAKVS